MNWKNTLSEIDGYIDEYASGLLAKHELKQFVGSAVAEYAEKQIGELYPLTNRLYNMLLQSEARIRALNDRIKSEVGV